MFIRLPLWNFSKDFLSLHSLTLLEVLGFGRGLRSMSASVFVVLLMTSFKNIYLSWVIFPTVYDTHTRQINTLNRQNVPIIHNEVNEYEFFNE